MIPERRRLPATRRSLTSKVAGGGMEGYATTGLYSNNQAGEIFLRVGKAGSFVEGIFGVIAIEASQMLQYGIPLNKILEKWDHITFDQAELLRAFATSIRSHIAEVGGNPDLGYTIPTLEPTQCASTSSPTASATTCCSPTSSNPSSSPSPTAPTPMTVSSSGD